MGRFLLSRLVDGIVAIWGVVTIVFVVSRLLGDPAILLLPVGATEEQLQQLRAGLGLDRPIWEQYLTFLGGALRGDFGQSFQFMRPALSVVLERMPATMALAGSALLVGVVLGAVAGSMAALFRGTIVEGVVMLLALLGQATPVFWLGLLLILLFAVDLGLLPTGGYEGPASLILRASMVEGHPDNVAASVLGGITIAVGDPTIARRIEPPASLGLVVVVADERVLTRDARAALADEVPRGSAVWNIQHSALLVHALHTGALDDLSSALSDRLHQDARAANQKV